MLAEEVYDNRLPTNFLNERIAEYAKDRAATVEQQNGTLEKRRLYRNMLFSMPLCFNLFGHLRSHKQAAAVLLSSALSRDIATIDGIEVEWAPEGEHPLGDRTAFDAYVTYRTSDGKRGFIGVETKYTEPFSRTEYWKDRYQEVTTASSLFSPNAADALKKAKTNQMWRNAMLAIEVRKAFDEGFVAVVSTKKDRGAQAAVAGLSDQLLNPPELVRFASLEEIIALASNQPVLADWAKEFERRYLDTSPVEGVL